MQPEYMSRTLKRDYLKQAREAIEHEDLLTKARLHKVRLCLDVLADYLKREDNAKPSK